MRVGSGGPLRCLRRCAKTGAALRYIYLGPVFVLPGTHVPVGPGASRSLLPLSILLISRSARGGTTIWWRRFRVAAPILRVRVARRASNVNIKGRAVDSASSVSIVAVSESFAIVCSGTCGFAPGESSCAKSYNVKIAFARIRTVPLPTQTFAHIIIRVIA